MKDDLKIRILVADDHFVVRMGLIALVNTEPDMEVVGEAADGNQAVDVFERCNPNLVLMDLRMPVKDGIASSSGRFAGVMEQARIRPRSTSAAM